MGFHIIPPFAMEQINLSDDQKQKLAALEKDTRDKLAQILSADQMKKLEEARPPRRGGGRGPGGGGAEGGGGPGGDQGGGGGGGAGNGPSDRPPRPPRGQ
jgi:hypothetical protein